MRKIIVALMLSVAALTAASAMGCKSADTGCSTCGR
jgi:hypothetical protein